MERERSSVGMAAERGWRCMDAKAELVAFLRDNAGELARLLRARYRREYPHSVRHELTEDDVLKWIESLLGSIARGVERGTSALTLGQMRTGDMVVHRQKLVGPVFTLTENFLFFGETLASVVMQRYINDVELADAMVDCLEGCIRTTVVEANREFCRKLERPGALVEEWKRANMDFSAHGQEVEPAERAAQTGVALSQREQQIIDLILQGKSNGEIAAVLGLQLSTVKNNVSRILAKYGVASRTELTVRLLKGKNL